MNARLLRQMELMEVASLFTQLDLGQGWLYLGQGAASALQALRLQPAQASATGAAGRLVERLVIVQ